MLINAVFAASIVALLVASFVVFVTQCITPKGEAIENRIWSGFAVFVFTFMATYVVVGLSFIISVVLS